MNINGNLRLELLLVLSVEKCVSSPRKYRLHLLERSQPALLPLRQIQPFERLKEGVNHGRSDVGVVEVAVGEVDCNRGGDVLHRNGRGVGKLESDADENGDCVIDRCEQVIGIVVACKDSGDVAIRVDERWSKGFSRRIGLFELLNDISEVRYAKDPIVSSCRIHTIEVSRTLFCQNHLALEKIVSCS